MVAGAEPLMQQSTSGAAAPDPWERTLSPETQAVLADRLVRCLYSIDIDVCDSGLPAWKTYRLNEGLRLPWLGVVGGILPPDADGILWANKLAVERSVELNCREGILFLPPGTDMTVAARLLPRRQWGSQISIRRYPSGILLYAGSWPQGFDRHFGSGYD